MWNLKWNSYIFIQENTFENIICEEAVFFFLRLNMLSSNIVYGPYLMEA